MTPQEFVTKWSRIQQKETAVSQSHFNDICALIGHKPPIEHDPTGRDFSFETQAVKPDGGKGFADVFFRGHFIWEYKGPHKDLDRAYRQLQLYRESLHNPPLLITSDIHTIHIHTNFTGYPTVKHTITFDDILTGGGVEKLRWAFTAPQKFTPEKTRAYITKATADTLLAVAEEMKKHREISGEAYNNEQLAHFLVRLLFTLFAEDLGLLPNDLFTKMVRVQGDGYSDLGPALRELFIKMRGGGMFGMWRVRHFDGTLFDDDFVPDIPSDLGESLLRAAEQDWSQVDPSIFGTLFERVIDEGKRAQLGAHYTSESDIMLIVEPVLMEPLRREWQQVRQRVNELLAAGEAQHSTGSNQQSTEDTAVSIQSEFADKISRVRVLDPACGSGNFLYVALRQLLDLQKEVIAYAARKGLPPIVLSVGPEQIYGIEINPYAQELAQVTVWIGYLQWRMENGFTELSDPILRPLRNLKRMDAILAYDEDGNPAEPEWPAADVIIGNPPFLGTKMMRVELGDIYVNEAQSLYRDRLPKDVDLVCYWFEKARAEIAGRGAGRAGLLATNSIRGGSNREVLRRIKETGDIFMAWSDRPWILEGAAVRVSLVGFDNGAEQSRTLDGQRVTRINADLTRAADLTQAHLLLENKNFAFMGDTKQGPFDIDWKTAKPMLDAAENPNGRPNHDVIRLWYNGMDVTRRPRNRWIIDFGVDMPEEEAAQYLAPFAYVKQRVKPARAKNKRSWYREQWWLHYAPRPIMRQAIDPLARYIATPTVAKHRVFVWLTKEILPDHQLIVFARDDDYFFGVLHSRLHEIWSLRMGTSLEDRPRYTPTTTFQTFPFPRPPGQELSEQDDPRVAAIAQWARALARWRQAWLNPPPPENGGIDMAYEKRLKVRTLTNLYNGLVEYRERKRPGDSFYKVTRGSVTWDEIQELADIHAALDTAVLDAYGWPHDLTDEQILERLLSLNLERAGEQL